MIECLLAHGMSLQTASRVVEKLRRHGSLWDTGARVKVLVAGPLVTTIDLAVVKAELDVALLELEARAS